MTRLLWSTVVWLLLPCSLLMAQPTVFTLNTFAGPPLSMPDQTGFYDQVLRAAFSRIGMSVAIGHLPAERSLLNADRGIDDGDFARIAGLERLYPNLIMVPEKIDDFEFVAFTKNLQIKTTDWSVLNPYHVGIVRGWKILEEHLAGVRELTTAKNQEQLFLLLKNGRIDAAVYAHKEGLGLLAQLGIADAQALSPPLAIRPMHLYLHKKHAALVEPLVDALRRMKADGSYMAIRRQTLSPIFPVEAPVALP